VLALAFVFLRAIWLVASPLRRSSRHAGSNEYAFFHTQLGHYAACLLGGNLFASAAGTVVGHWVILGGMHEGKLRQSVESMSHSIVIYCYFIKDQYARRRVCIL
jgi:hypothetical protein